MREEVFLQYFQVILTAMVLEINESNRQYNLKTAELLQEILDELRKGNSIA